MSLKLSALSLAFIPLLVASCSSTAPSSGFLGKDDAKMTKNSDLPFSRSWKADDSDLSKYKKVAVAPMKTDKLKPLGKTLGGASERNVGDTHAKDSAKLAGFATGQFKTKIDASEGRSAEITSTPGRASDTMVLETNLVQAVPGKPAFQILNYFIPFTSYANRPSIAIEGRLKDARTGKTLFVFSDLERPGISFIDGQKFTYYGTQRRESEYWAKQITKLIETNGSGKIYEAFPVKPITW